jgi:hypothetical protein
VPFLVLPSAAFGALSGNKRSEGTSGNGLVAATWSPDGAGAAALSVEEGPFAAVATPFFSSFATDDGGAGGVLPESCGIDGAARSVALADSPTGAGSGTEAGSELETADDGAASGC